jgi:exodeoxyribonuclease VII large subunit
MSLISDLLHFREEAARREGIESFRVFPKATLDAIVLARPQSKEELTSLKGIKEAKYNKYGQSVLAIVAAHGVGRTESRSENTAKEEDSLESEGEEKTIKEPETFSVDEFLESINTELSGLAARVRGEVSEVNIWQNKLVFFSLKDGTLDSTLKCSMSYQAYQVSEVFFQVGDEIIIEGFAKMYKPRGELSFQVLTAEFFGEGALKKAYDELYKKLETEGAFDPSTKRTLPLYPERIALITSKDGAAIGDFQMNIGRFGLSVHLYPSGVEGKRAVLELLRAIKYFRKHESEYDALVIVRGGGSLESLQAFNNEALVREIQNFPIPVLCGIGHEKDVTLAALVGDRMESTPTACALALTEHWEEARHKLSVYQEKLPRAFEGSLREQKELLVRGTHFLFDALRTLKERVEQTEEHFVRTIFFLEQAFSATADFLAHAQVFLPQAFKKSKERIEADLKVLEKRLTSVDPRLVLQLGYSLVRSQGKLIRNSKDVSVGDILEVELSEGSVSTEVKQIKE